MSTINDQCGIKGELLIEVFGPDGKLKDRRHIKNLTVDAGKALIASRMCGAGTPPSHMAVGTGATAAAVGQTTLVAEVARVALASATPAANVATFAASFPAGTGTGALTEAGLFNAGASGTMSNRSVFSVVNKGALDSMSISWTLTIN
jgi:hypothetical protein